MDDLCNWFTISITTRGEKIWKTFINSEFYLKKDYNNAYNLGYEIYRRYVKESPEWRFPSGNGLRGCWSALCRKHIFHTVTLSVTSPS